MGNHRKYRDHRPLCMVAHWCLYASGVLRTARGYLYLADSHPAVSFQIVYGWWKGRGEMTGVDEVVDEVGCRAATN